MAKGAYLGGHTVIRTAGGQVPRSPGRCRGSSTGPEHEKRKLAQKERDKKLRQQIRKNEKLARKLGKQWCQERGVRLFQELSAKQSREQTATALARVTAQAPGRSLAHAMQAALQKQAEGKNER
jgi:hypothetical protein